MTASLATQDVSLRPKATAHTGYGISAGHCDAPANEKRV